ncbi:DUF1211 domain-containing protein [Novosphingobium flavum]|uniref:DUF1211 domain-containing protein n=1 Tax=Novosphingobium flavum TaxID=1778672 RepID=A0A7X1FQZ9_9SPHN|nr:TMEM175 family protein [Novosphingobium flavum]MBC2664792.1 DUF1211 domain-containing protein [Novosphingobium flavum]
MSNRAEQTEGRGGVSRVEAFSDGVIAIIITIMVLELKAPEEEDLSALWHLWPTFLAYVLSYAYVAIYWVNHHRLFSHARRVTSGLLWSNIALLFALSLVPFSTAYLGEHHFARDPTIVYLVTMLLPAVAYAWLQGEIMKVAECSAADQRYLIATRRKGQAATVVYFLGVPLAFVTPWLGIAAAALVAVFWCLPFSRLDALFLPEDCAA